MKQSISGINPRNPPGAFSQASNSLLQRNTCPHWKSKYIPVMASCSSPQSNIQHALVSQLWCQRSCGLQTVSAISKAASYLRRVTYEALNNIITTCIKTGFDFVHICGEAWKPSALLLLHSLLAGLTQSHWRLPFPFFLLFVSLPVFIKLVKFPLQHCQPCIVLCCAHHSALQLPGNWVWRRYVKEAENTFWHKVNIKQWYIKYMESLRVKMRST